MKKWLTAALAALMLLSPLSSISCATSSEGDESGTETSGSQGTDSTVSESDIAEAPPTIEKQDYKGATFRMVTIENAPGTWYYAEEFINTGDNTHILNNTIFEMNTMVEEYLGVELEMENVPVVNGGEVFSTVQPTLMSGDDVYQLCILHPYYSYNSFISQNYALDFYSLDELDLDKAYWNADVMEQLSINGKAYIGLGDLCRYQLNILYCNKGLIQDMSRKVPYDHVRNGTWTFDEFAALTANVYRDDGNGKKDNLDTYGYAALWDANASAFMQAADIYVLTRNTEDTYELSLYSERLLNFYEKLFQWSQGESTFLWSFGNRLNPDMTIDFHNGQTYVTMESLGTHYLDATFEVGILPLPKYDVAQEEYCHVNWGNNIVLPTTIQDKEMVGRVLEMMAYYSRTHVLEVYYNDVLQLRASNAPDDREMVELIYSTVVFDPGIAYCDGYTPLWNLVYLPTFTILEKNKNIASYYQKNERQIDRQKVLEKIFDVDNE